MDINVKYFGTQEPLNYTGDWVDVRVGLGVSSLDSNGRPLNQYRTYDDANGKYYLICKGDMIKVPLGFALDMPQGHEAILKPRGSLSGTTGLLFACSGVIDEGYKGDDDEWFVVLYATRMIKLYLHQRICQFRIQQKQPNIQFKSVQKLNNPNRGGYGSTGRF